jgi:membrane peptidoglycan carboxypeptidase
VLRAFLVSEDGRFFQHHGFDQEMIRHALAADLSLGRIDRGASTLTQQLVKNLYLSGERTAARKLEEAVLTWRMEQLVPKRRILEYYLNLVEFGPGVFGVADAAERYFGKEPEELGADEAAQLAALLPAPRRGMDGAWEHRYRSLLQRLPSETVFIPGTDAAPAVKLSQR